MKFLVIAKVKPIAPVDMLAKLTPAQIDYFSKLELQGKIEKLYHMIGYQGTVFICDVKSEEELSSLISQDPMFFCTEREIYPLISMEKHRKLIKNIVSGQ